MKARSVKLQVSSFGDEEIKGTIEVLKSGFLTMGRKTLQFQEEWSRWLNVPYSTMVNSGSSANLLLIQLLLSRRGNYKFDLGSEVLVPAVTWSTTLFPIIQLGLKPVLVDVKEHTFEIDVASCKQALSKKTKAVFLVHLLGNPVNTSEIVEFCNENGLIILEDCCESHGAKWGDQKVGTFGIGSSFSFMFAHHMSTIEGGMVCCKTQLDDCIIKAARAHGWIREINETLRHTIRDEAEFDDDRFLFWDTGYNVRPTEIASELGIHQLGKLNSFIEIRERNFEIYQRGTETIEDKIQIQRLEDSSKSVRSNFAFGFFIRDVGRYSRRSLIHYLEQHGIESRPLVAGNLARHPFYLLYCEPPRVSLENSDKIHFGGLYLPNHQNMTGEDVEYVVDRLRAFFS